MIRIFGIKLSVKLDRNSDRGLWLTKTAISRV